jgi:hypothetical protein
LPNALAHKDINLAFAFAMATVQFYVMKNLGPRCQLLLTPVNNVGAEDMALGLGRKAQEAAVAPPAPEVEVIAPPAAKRRGRQSRSAVAE